MSYYYSKIFKSIEFDTVKSRVIEELSKEGFGIVSEIDIQATMKQKLNKEYLPHIILGACNPEYADQLLTIEPTISTLLPCNITIRLVAKNEVEVSAINPKALLSIVSIQGMTEMAAGVAQQLKGAIERI